MVRKIQKQINLRDAAESSRLLAEIHLRVNDAIANLVVLQGPSLDETATDEEKTETRKLKDAEREELLDTVSDIVMALTGVELFSGEENIEETLVEFVDV